MLSSHVRKLLQTSLSQIRKVLQRAIGSTTSGLGTGLDEWEGKGGGRKDGKDER